MTNQDHIIEIERQLIEAKRAASPVIVTKVSEDKDQVVYQNETSGTRRVDLKGGSPVQYEDRTVPKPEVHYFDKPLDPAVGKVTKTTETDRTIKLVSGTRRVDYR